MTTLDAVRELLSNQPDLPKDPTQTLDLPSFELIVLTEALEERFRIRVLASELVPENFGTLQAISAYVDRKCG